MAKLFTFLLALIISSSVFADAKADRKKILERRDATLERLYKEEPETRKMIAKAEGYATFSNIGVNVLFVSAGGGSGVVHDNDSGKDTFMKMGSAGVGIGLGVKDFNAVFVFHNDKAMNDFIEYGWDFSGQADAAAKSGDKGDEGSMAATVVNGVSIYQMTENGLALQATLQGTKYWVDKELNSN